MGPHHSMPPRLCAGRLPAAHSSQLRQCVRRRDLHAPAPVAGISLRFIHRHIAFNILTFLVCPDWSPSTGYYYMHHLHTSTPHRSFFSVYLRPSFFLFFFFNDPAPPEISLLPLPDPLPI